MKFKDLREDIFDIQAAKKIHWLYRGDDYISYLDLKFAPEKIEDIVFSMEDLVKPISLTLEDAEIGSRWKLHIPAYMTQQFTIKQHDFTITIKLVEGEEITLFKGIVNVNKRIFSKAVDDELASTVKTEEDPTEEDNNYRIGTHWVNTDTEVVYVLVKVDDGIAVWKDVTHQSVIDYVLSEEGLIEEWRVASGSLKGLMSSEDKTKLENIWSIFDNGEDEHFVDTIKEIIEIFNDYPEGVTVIERLGEKANQTYVDQELNKKVDKTTYNDKMEDLDKKAVYKEVEMDVVEYENLFEYDINTLYFVSKVVEGKEEIFLYKGETLISGGGEMGGGALVPLMRFVPSPIAQDRNFSAVVGEEVEFGFEYTHEEQAPAVFNIYRNGALISSRSLSVGIHQLNLEPYIFIGTNTIKLEVIDYLDQVRMITLNVVGVEISVSSSYQETNVSDGEVLFPYFVSLVGENSKVYFKIDDEEPIVDMVTTANNIKQLTLDNGNYLLEFWATTELDGREITSNKLRFIVLVDDGTYEDTMLASKIDITEIEYGERLSLEYIAYNRLNENIRVEGYVDDVRRIDLNVISGVKNTWNIGVLEEGLHELKLEADGKTLTYSVNVVEGDVSIRSVDDITLQTYLTAVGKDNADTTKDIWLNSGTNGTTYPFVMNDFNYASNGWIDDSLVFNGRAKAILEYQPFAQEIGFAGKTIEIEFHTPAVHDGSNIIECMSDDIGFEIKGNKTSLHGSNVNVDAYYPENNKVKVTFVINKAQSKVYLYLDGVLTNQDDLVSNTRFVQDTPTYIKFNDNLQDLMVYNFRVYDRALEPNEVLENYFYDIPNVNKKFEEYAKSLIYDGGKVSREKVKQIIPVMTVSLTGALPSDPNYRPYATEIRYENIFNEDLNFRRNDVRIRTQGTSTLVYPVKNFRLYQGSLDLEPVKLVDGSRPAHILNLKTDYVDSSVATNAVLAKLFEGMYDKGTPPIEDYPEEEFRTTIYGSPVALFHNNNGVINFVGLYSLNNDKSEPAIYGHGVAPYEFSHRFEITQNLGDSAGAFVKKDGLTEQEWFEELKADFEPIYPKDLYSEPNYEQLKIMVEFIANFDLDNIGSMSEQDIENYKDEFEDRFDLEYITKYFIVASMFGLLDSFGKNLQLNVWEQNGEYKWYVTFYDLDTAIGLDNEGKLLDSNGNLIYDYNIELEHGEGFAQADSKLWKVFVALYDEHIKEVYQDVRANYFTDDKIYKSFFDDHIDVIGKSIYNDSNFFKYVLAAGSQAWNYMLNGDRKLQIKSWVSNRLKFLDSKYVAGTDVTDKMIAFRMSFEAGDFPELEITPHFHQYAIIQFGNPNVEGNIVGERTDAYEPVTVKYMRNVGAEFLECRVYGADNIAEVKGFTDFDVDSLDLQYAINLLKVDLSKDVPYDKLTNLGFGNNVLLKEINLKNLIGLQGNLDLKGLVNLQKLNIEGTNLLSIELANGGALEELYLNDTLTSLTLRNLNYLETLEYESLDDVKELTIENTPLIVSDILADTPNLTHLRVRNYNISTNDKNVVLDLLNAVYDSAESEYRYGTIKANTELSTDLADLKQMVSGEIRLQIEDDLDPLEWALLEEVLPHLNVEVTNLTQFEDYDMNDLDEFYEIAKYNGQEANLTLPIGYNALLDSEETVTYFGFDGWKLVKGVGDEAFDENLYIRTINFGSEITYVGAKAFRNTNIIFDELPTNVEKVGEQAFYGHKNNLLYLTKDLKEVGANAFYGTNANAMVLVGHPSKPDLWAENWTNSTNVIWNKDLIERTFMVGEEEVGKGYILNALPTLTQEGYIFDKFTYNGVEVTLPFIPDNEMPRVIHIIPNWEIINYTVSYPNLDENVDNTLNPDTFTVEDLPITLNRPIGTPSGVDSGWVWDGWYTASSGGNKITEITTIGNKTFYGRWREFQFGDLTPQDIYQAVLQGNQGSFTVRQTKTITLTNGDEVELRVVDNSGSIIKRSDGTYAGLVIDFRHIYQNAQMNGSDTNTGGWRDSKMRNETMPTLYALLPQEWKNIISQAQIQTMDGGNQEGTELVTTLDYLWLPSEREIFASNAYTHEDEWNALTRFGYYATSGSRQKQSEGSSNHWWLRSASSSNSNSFVRVSNAGRPYNSDASDSYGVSPCFII